MLQSAREVNELVKQDIKLAFPQCADGNWQLRDIGVGYGVALNPQLPNGYELYVTVEGELIDGDGQVIGDFEKQYRGRQASRMIGIGLTAAVTNSLSR